MASFDMLSDDLVAEILYRAPAFSHGPLTAVCKLFRRIINDEAFIPMCRKLKLTEPVVLAFGGCDRSGRDVEDHEYLSALVAGQQFYLSDPTTFGANLYHATLDGALVLIGGERYDGTYSEVVDSLEVHVYDVVADVWQELIDPYYAPALRSNAACAAVGDRIIIAGGAERSDPEEEFDFDTPTTSVVALTVKRSDQGAFEASWTKLPSLPHTHQSNMPSFALNDQFYIITGKKLLMLDEAANTWVPKAALPKMKGRFAAGAVHSGRFFLLKRNSHEKPTIYAYHADDDTWELQPMLDGPVPDLLDAESLSYGRCEHVTMTPCAAGLLVLGRQCGRVALLNMIDGVITSAHYLSDVNWSEGHSRYAQDGRLAGLHAASFELSWKCRPLLKAWAEAIEEEQFLNDECYDSDDSDDNNNGQVRELVDNLHEARAWLKHAGLATNTLSHTEDGED